MSPASTPSPRSTTSQPVHSTIIMTAVPKATLLHTKPQPVGKCFRSMLKEHTNALVKGTKVRLKVLIASPVVQTEEDQRIGLSEDCSLQPYHSLKRFPFLLSKLLPQHYRSRSVQRPNTTLATRHVSARRNWFGRSSVGVCPDIVKEALCHGYVKYSSPKARARSPVEAYLSRRRRVYRRSQSHLE